MTCLGYIFLKLYKRDGPTPAFVFVLDVQGVMSTCKVEVDEMRSMVRDGKISMLTTGQVRVII